MKLFSRISFTMRLLLAAGAVTLLLVAVDYATLLELPARVATDSVEVALRENTQSFNDALRDERLSLRDRVDTFVDDPLIDRAIRSRDQVALAERLSELDPGVRAKFLPHRVNDISSFGVVSVQQAVGDRGSRSSVVFYTEVDNAVLDRAAEDAGGDVSFAVERGGEFVAKSSKWPSSVRAKDVSPHSDRAGHLEPISVDDHDLHVFSRELTPDPSYQLHALSTNHLEDDALTDTRSDVQHAIIVMTIATIVGSLLIAMFTSRSVRAFAGRVRELADGNYERRLPVRGRDSFADLADSVNRLSAELEERMSQLERTASAFRSTLETLEEGICTWDEAGAITYWNRGAEQLTSIPRERAGRGGEPVLDFLHAERTPGVRRVTLPVRRSGGGLVVDLVVTAMPGGGVVQTFRDTTIVDVLQQTQKNFMATAAHELRTPITTILGFADTLTNPALELNEPQRAEFLAIIRDQSRQLQQIAEAFFTNHQLANERVEVSLRPTSVAGVVADALDRFERTKAEARIDVEEIAVEVPPDLLVLADRRALIGVLAILLDNAVKYGRAPIAVTAERNGGTVTMAVSDAGPGIDAFHHNRIFDPFYRIDVDMRSGVGGAGLGLFTARKLVEAMHGLIRVRSAPGAGATFTVELPLATEVGVHDPEAGPDEPRLRLVGG